MAVWKLSFEYECPEGMKPHWALASATDAVDDVGFKVKGETGAIERVYPPLRVLPDKAQGSDK